MFIIIIIIISIMWCVQLQVSLLANSANAGGYSTSAINNINIILFSHRAIRRCRARRPL